MDNRKILCFLPNDHGLDILVDPTEERSVREKVVRFQQIVCLQDLEYINERPAIYFGKTETLVLRVNIMR